MGEELRLLEAPGFKVATPTAAEWVGALFKRTREAPCERCSALGSSHLGAGDELGKYSRERCSDRRSGERF